MAVPSITQDVDELYVSTWPVVVGRVVNAAYNATVLTKELMEKKNMRPQVGGLFIQRPINFNKNATVKWVGRGGTVSLDRPEGPTASQWQWKRLVVNITRYVADEQMNSGKHQIFDMVRRDMNDAESAISDEFEEAFHGDGTGDGGEQCVGFAKSIAEDPTTGTLANIDRSVYTGFRNQYQDMANYPASTYLVNKMRAMFRSCGRKGVGEEGDSRGKGGANGIRRFPNLLSMAEDVYGLYEEEADPKLMIQSNKYADMGFGDLTFKGRPMIWSPAATDGRLYFLNTHFIEWVYDPRYYFTMTPWKEITNQAFDRAAQIICIGSLLTTAPDRQGVMFNIS